MNVTVDGYPLELRVIGGSLIVVQNDAMRGALSLADPPADPVPTVLEADGGQS